MQIFFYSFILHVWLTYSLSWRKEKNHLYQPKTDYYQYIEMNTICVLKWTVIGLALLTIIMAIATISVDQEQNTEEKQSKTGINIFLMIMMIGCAAPAIWYYWSNRLVWILAMVVLSVIFVIMRCSMPLHANFHLTFPVLLNMFVGSVYIYWALFHSDDPHHNDDGIWRSLTRVDVNDGGAGPSASSTKAVKKKSSKRLTKK